MTDDDIPAAAPPPPRRTRRSATTLAAQVLEAAATEFEASGYDGATTAAIARRAQVTETQLFRLHPSKRALFHAAVFEPMNRRFAAFNAHHLARGDASAPRERQVGDYIEALQAFIGENRRSLMALLAMSAFGSDTDAEFGRLDALGDYFDLSAGMMNSRIGTDPAIDAQLMVRVSFATVLGNVMLRNLLFPERLATDAAVNDVLIRFVTNGIAPSAAPVPSG